VTGSIGPYSCEDVFLRLDDFLDRELSAVEMRLVREHLETCAQCASEHRFEARVLDDVRAKLNRIRAPQSLLDRIRGLIEQEKAGSSGTDGPS
jgi:mycothiol system anti-sigma-R factor